MVWQAGQYCHIGKKLPLRLHVLSYRRLWPVVKAVNETLKRIVTPGRPIDDRGRSDD